MRSLSEINEKSCKATNWNVTMQEWYWLFHSDERLLLYHYYIWKYPKSRKTFQQKRKMKQYAIIPWNKGLVLILSNSNEKADINRLFHEWYRLQKPIKTYLSQTNIHVMTIVCMTKATKWTNGPPIRRQSVCKNQSSGAISPSQETRCPAKSPT